MMSDTIISREYDGWIVTKGDKRSDKYNLLSEIKESYKEIAKEIGEEDPSTIQRLLLKMALTKEPIKKNRLDDLVKDVERRTQQEEKITHNVLAEELLKIDHYATMKDTKEIYFYKDGIYQPKGEILIEENVQKVFSKKVRNQFINEVIGYIKRETYEDRSLFDSDPALINVENGILDINTGERIPHDPEYLSIKRVPITHDPEAKAPKIEKFLIEVCPDPIFRQTLIEWSGYCLYHDYHIHSWLILLGEGRNGKTTFLNLLKSLLGEKNVSHIRLQDLDTKRFLKAELYGKMANIRANIPKNPLKYVGTLLELTGGDSITADVKHKDPFDFVNTAKMSFGANTLPKTEDRTDAFFSRPLIVEFPNQFNKGDEKTDPKLLEKLTTKEELSGFLNLALKGLKDLLKRGQIFYPFSTDDMREQYQRFSDPLYEYIEANVKSEPKEAITKGKMYEDYVIYSTEHKLSLMTSNVFSRKIKSYIIQLGGSDGWTRVEGKMARAWRGVRLKTDREKKGLTPLEVESKNNTFDLDSCAVCKETPKTIYMYNEFFYCKDCLPS